MTVPGGDPWGRRILDGLERKNLWIVALASAGAWPLFSAATALNVMGAGILGALNLRALRRTIETYFGGGQRPSRWFMTVSTIRFFLFFNLIVVVFLVFPVQVPAFTAGLSTIVVAALAEAVGQALAPGESRPEEE
jgi:hypothetical protein